MPIKEICEKYDLSTTVLKRTLKEYNIPNKSKASKCNDYGDCSSRAEDELPLQAHRIL